MTATQIIAEIDRLPPEEQQTVFHHIHHLEEELVPGSFRQGMAEAEKGDLTEMEDGHFQVPPPA